MRIPVLITRVSCSSSLSIVLNSSCLSSSNSKLCVSNSERLPDSVWVSVWVMQPRNLFPSSKLGYLKKSIHLLSIPVPSFLFATSYCLLLCTGHSEWPRHPLPAPLSRLSLTPPHPKSHITPLQAPTVPFAF